MLPEKYRRLWRRRLRRRPLLPFLAAATVSVDALIAAASLASLPGSVRSVSLGLLDGHLALAAIYLAVGDRPVAFRALVGVTAALAYALIEGDGPTGQTAFFALVSVLTQAAACRVLARFIASRRPAKRQTSIGSLLVWTLCVAIACVWARSLTVDQAMAIFANRYAWVGLAVQVLLTCTAFASSRLLRETFACGVTALIVAKLVVLDTTVFDWTLGESLAYHGTAACMILMWLLGARSLRRSVGSATNATPQPPSPSPIEAPESSSGVNLRV